MGILDVFGKFWIKKCGGEGVIPLPVGDNLPNRPYRGLPL
jgi:hypothetical protein